MWESLMLDTPDLAHYSALSGFGFQIPVTGDVAGVEPWDLLHAKQVPYH